MFSESHCHLHRLSDNALGKTIEQAEKAGVELVLVAGIDLASSQHEISIAKKYHILKACVGMHPWNADQYSEEAIHELKDLATDAEVVAISEIGLDYVGRRTRENEYVDTYVDKEVQRRAFRAQLRAAKEVRLPVLVHDRTLDQEVLDVLEEEGSSKTGAVIHGFSKDLAYAKRCVEIGVYLSIGLRGISEQENKDLREAIRWTPLEWLLTETDSESPKDVLTVAERVAELKDSRRDDVGRATTKNLRRLTKL